MHRNFLGSSYFLHSDDKLMFFHSRLDMLILFSESQVGRNLHRAIDSGCRFKGATSLRFSGSALKVQLHRPCACLRWAERKPRSFCRHWSSYLVSWQPAWTVLGQMA